MLTFKRAVLVAAALLTLIFLLRTTHSNDSISPLSSSKEPKEPATTTTEHNPAPVIDKKPRPQIPLTDLRSRPLRQQLAYQFPYELEAKFPNYIWQTWKYTPADASFDERYRPYEASWTEKHPGFVHEVISDGVAVHLMNHLYAAVPEVLEAYNALPVPVLKADFFRYLILLARGGIYSDIDTSAIQPAFDWVPTDVARETYGMVIGIEADPDRPDWADWYSRRIQFCQWTIQSKPGHPILREIVAAITEDTLRRKKEGTLSKSLIKSIVEFTGPALWTDKIFDFFNDPTYFDMSTSGANITWKDFTGITKAKKVGDVIVLPITSFSPGVKQMGAGEDDDPMAFVKHNFEGS
ncbi:hypothetical protein ANO11243_007510 [Dothideomycetidae sp. 11243]|nr:hypothetical protein ANO11243_007510 [fungal sp. No.11243]